MDATLEAYNAVTKAKLEEARFMIKLLGLDYDGTVSDGNTYTQTQVFALAEKVLDANKSIAFVTARAATALKVLFPPLQQLLMRKNAPVPCFIAGGNGTTLYEVKKDGLVMIYNNGFTLQQVLCVVGVGRDVYARLQIGHNDLVEKGLRTFETFLQDSWAGYVPDEIIYVCRPFRGELFTEEAKVTFVLPKDASLRGIIVSELNAALGSEYCAMAGDSTYVHITRRLSEDSKAFAIKAILQRMGLTHMQVATFGDMPMGNDKGLLSFPYSFTNAEDFIRSESDLQAPPFVLACSGVNPVAMVYHAVEMLITTSQT